MPTVHSTALVDPKAQLAKDVTVGPYTMIGPQVHVGAGTTIGAHVVLEGRTTVGARCRIFSGAVLGAVTQDRKFKGQPGLVRVGDDTTIREYVTIHAGTEEGSTTQVGRGNFIMAYAHIAHDCIVGNQCVIANAASFGGHVTLEDRVTIGGLVGVHQFVRIGRLAIVGGCSKVVQDVVPFALCDGHPARVHGLNVIGLRRAGITPPARRQIQGAFRLLFADGLSTAHALKRVKDRAGTSPEIQHLVSFIRQSKRGFCRGQR